MVLIFLIFIINGFWLHILLEVHLTHEKPAYFLSSAVALSWLLFRIIPVVTAPNNHIR